MSVQAESLVIGPAGERQVKADRRSVARRARSDRLLLKQQIKALQQEAYTYCDILIACWARRGAAYMAKSAGVATDGKPVNFRKVAKVQIARIRLSPERISIKIAVTKRTIFGWRSLLPYRTDLADLTNDKALFEASASIERRIVFDDFAFKKNKGAWFHIYRLEGVGGIPTRVGFHDTLRFYPEDMSAAPLCLGVGDNRAVRMVTLAQYPHVLIGGTTGGGKSNMIKNMISALVRFTTPDEVRLALVDFKTLEFAFYEHLPHLWRPVVTEPESALALLDDLLAELKSRIQQMKGIATDLAEWNAANPGRKFPRIIVFVDEFAELSLSDDKHVKDRTLLLIARLTALGRAIGIHMVACTQRPAAEIMPMTIKANLPLIISGPVPSQHHSMTMLGNGDAAKIEEVPGRMIYKANLEIHQVQTPLVTADDRREAIRIARGRSLGVIALAGIDPVINPARLAAFLVKYESGSLDPAVVRRILCEFAITKKMFAAFRADLVRLGRIELAGRPYNIVDDRIVAATPILAAEPIPGPESPTPAPAVASVGEVAQPGAGDTAAPVLRLVKPWDVMGRPLLDPVEPSPPQAAALAGMRSRNRDKGVHVG